MKGCPSPLPRAWTSILQTQNSLNSTDKSSASSRRTRDTNIRDELPPMPSPRFADKAPDLVAVLSPFHSFAPYPLITTSHQAYTTPLGNIEIDQSAFEELQKNLDIPITPIANDKEHSLEIELPFLQRVLKNEFKLLPIMVRAQEEDVAKKLGEALAQTLKKKNAIMVASTDLSHFYDQETAHIFDHAMLQCFESLNPYSIFEAEYTGKGFACGHAAVAASLWASKKLGADKVQILNYATSGDVTHDHSSVVGYGAAAILKTI
jgi:MEMO1 family protein